MAIKIEKGIPMPTNKKSELHEALESMEVDDSFELPEGTSTSGVYRLASDLGITIKIIEGRVWKTSNERTAVKRQKKEIVAETTAPHDEANYGGPAIVHSSASA